MNTIFTDLLDNRVVRYLDEMLIHWKTRPEHILLVKEILSMQRADKLSGNIEKPLPFTEEVEFLGGILSGYGTQLAQSKAKAIAEWTAQTTLKELHGFLGFGNFLRHFIHR